MPMMMHLYHATDANAALSIDQSRRFRLGKRGYAGPGIYFATDEASAIKHSFNGNPDKKATVVIHCRVDVGQCLRAEKHTMDKAKCAAARCNSVRIKGTNTYAVYDPERISIMGFKTVADKAITWSPSMKKPITTSAPPSRCPSKKKLKNEDTHSQSKSPVEILITSIEASASGSLNTSRDMCELYLKHPRLQQAIVASGGLQAFCSGHPEFARDGELLSLSLLPSSTSGPVLLKQISVVSLFDRLSSPSSESATSRSDVESESLPSDSEVSLLETALDKESSLSELAVETLLAAIEASPTASLNAFTDVADLCLVHPWLRDALIEAGGLDGLCNTHPELTRDGELLLLSSCGSSTACSDVQNESSPPESETSTSEIDLENDPLPAVAILETLLAAIEASPTKCLDACRDVAQLCLVHPWFRDALNEAGGLQMFCKAHPELTFLTRDGELLLLSSSEAMSLIPSALQGYHVKTDEDDARQLMKIKQVEMHQARMNAISLCQMHQLRMNAMWQFQLRQMQIKPEAQRQQSMEKAMPQQH